ncbi:uncharacterized protein AMSG_02434 [Thecamonas trahens ATCC 50062]|uniref:Calx-beta domain-containing protein n=1 Tax=Thecamonas trahens ATCC 50062 TaxID=461836 RepID=A0A0L0DWJ9_THETB|nr:hypothetical protein AMSG_02434 [Thecamonas trahens ATCC 50062]KNC56466.1 hypothetical protein AMSG_02434 [Thecamonas trahens ATCC 50062]|eukprot:XP_013760975.1 hypothetical protein AMSG_02434 [Thecamonas trahens ATCC 50062]
MTIGLVNTTVVTIAEFWTGAGAYRDGGRRNDDRCGAASTTNELVVELALSRPSEYATGLVVEVDGVTSTADVKIKMRRLLTLCFWTGSPMTIPALATTHQVSVVVSGDGVLEPTEVLELGLVAQYNDMPATIDVVNVTATITNDDAAVVTMAAGTVAATEPGSGVVNVPITVTMDTTASRGRRKTVYNAVVAADAWYDGGETFDVKLTGTSTPGVSVGVADTTVVTITDSGPAQVKTATVVGGTTTAVSGAGTDALSVSGPEGAAVSSGSLATGGTDFTVETTTVTIPAGSTSAVYNAVVAADAWYDGGETFDVKLTGTSTAGASIGVADTTVVTIADSGPAPVLTATVVGGTTTAVSGAGTDALSVTGPEGAASTTNELVVELALSRPSEYAAGLTVQVDGVTTTADVPSDATIVDTVARTGSPMTIPALATTHQVSVVVSGDGVLEPTEVLELGLVAQYNDMPATIDVVNVTATITNDDAAVVTMAVGTAAATEPGSGTVNVPITVTMDTTASYDVVVDVATSVSSGSLATGGTDFTMVLELDSAATTVSIPADAELVGTTDRTTGPFVLSGLETHVNVSMLLKGDAIVEPHEVLQFGVVAIHGGAEGAVVVANVTGNVFDEDTSVVTMAVASVAATEPSSGSVSLPIVIEMTSVVASDTVVNITVAPSSGSLVTSGTDFVAETVTLVIPSGSRSVVYNASIAADAWYDGGETFDVAITGVSEPATTGLQDTTVVTIIDSGPAPTMVATVSSGAVTGVTGTGTNDLAITTATEGDAPATNEIVLDVTLSRPAEHPTSLQLVTSPTSTSDIVNVSTS